MIIHTPSPQKRHGDMPRLRPLFRRRRLRSRRLRRLGALCCQDASGQGRLPAYAAARGGGIAHFSGFLMRFHGIIHKVN